VEDKALTPYAANVVIWAYMKSVISRIILLCLLSSVAGSVFAQPELEPWGNLSGIRIDGQLMEFQSGIRLIGADGHIVATGKERQNPHFTRDGNRRFVNSRLDSLYFTEVVEDSGPGEARIAVTYTAHADMKVKGVFFTLDLPADQSTNATVGWIDSITGLRTDTLGPNHSHLEIPFASGDLQKGSSTGVVLTIKVGGHIDRQPIHLALNTATPGRPFDGLGGNFRIQNPRLDSLVVAYCLEHLRVAWGRVELPWRSWQPFEDVDPLDTANTNHLPLPVRRAMDMAHTLGEKKIPIILSAWFPPDWAVEGPVRFRPGPDHIWGNPLKKSETKAIYKSIADYIIFLKQRYSTEVKYFSFNESDLGINIRQTATDHDELIKGLGAYFASRGLATRVLLGDNSDATTWSFIDSAMNDPAARPWLAAISFHSWRGWDTATLQKWADAATRMHLPLLVAEGSIDAAAWSYPAIFRESAYALKEIALYIRLLAICQPLSILQWQLTSDYSLLAGGGIFGDTGALRPTQRFWNLKQLSMTPKDLFAMPVTCDRPRMTIAALGDKKQHLYVLHLVNDGATREVDIDGLPAKVKSLRMYTTNETQAVKEGPPVKVEGGKAHFVLEAESFVTLVSQ
jgi:hypothetical protein